MSAWSARADCPRRSGGFLFLKPTLFSLFLKIKEKKDGTIKTQQFPHLFLLSFRCLLQKWASKGGACLP
jgi:hypothetical protein